MIPNYFIFWSFVLFWFFPIYPCTLCHVLIWIYQMIAFSFFLHEIIKQKFHVKEIGKKSQIIAIPFDSFPFILLPEIFLFSFKNSSFIHFILFSSLFLFICSSTVYNPYSWTNTQMELKETQSNLSKVWSIVKTQRNAYSGGSIQHLPNEDKLVCLLDENISFLNIQTGVVEGTLLPEGVFASFWLSWWSRRRQMSRSCALSSPRMELSCFMLLEIN